MNGIKIGLGSGAMLVTAITVAALFVWRLVEGATPADANAYVLLILGTASALGLGALRIWQNVKLAALEVLEEDEEA